MKPTKPKPKPHPLKARSVRVCADVNGPVAAEGTEWFHDQETGLYHRFHGETHLRAIHGDHLPDPERMVRQRHETLEAIIKHVSAETIISIAHIAADKGQDPGEAIMRHFEPRLQPAQATRELWAHWQGLKESEAGHADNHN